MRDGKLVTAEEQATGLRKGQYSGGHAKIEKMRGGPGHKSTLVVYLPGGSKITIKSPRIQTPEQFNGLSGTMTFAPTEIFAFEGDKDAVVRINFDLCPVMTFSATPGEYSEGS